MFSLWVFFSGDLATLRPIAYLDLFAGSPFRSVSSTCFRFFPMMISWLSEISGPSLLVVSGPSLVVISDPSLEVVSGLSLVLVSG